MSFELVFINKRNDSILIIMMNDMVLSIQAVIESNPIDVECCESCHNWIEMMVIDMYLRAHCSYHLARKILFNLTAVHRSVGRCLFINSIRVNSMVYRK